MGPPSALSASVGRLNNCPTISFSPFFKCSEAPPCCECRNWVRLINFSVIEVICFFVRFQGQSSSNLMTYLQLNWKVLLCPFFALSNSGKLFLSPSRDFQLIVKAIRQNCLDDHSLSRRDATSKGSRRLKVSFANFIRAKFRASVDW